VNIQVDAVVYLLIQQWFISINIIIILFKYIYMHMITDTCVYTKELGLYYPFSVWQKHLELHV
jgi:hypothetical protein